MGTSAFRPAAPLTSEDALRLRDLLRPALAEHGLDYSAALIPTGPRSFINVVLVVFDTSDEERTRAAFEVSKGLVPKAAELGYGEYRSHIDFMDLCATAYDFNDSARPTPRGDDQGRARPERDPDAGQAGSLAAAAAVVISTASTRWSAAAASACARE